MKLKQILSEQIALNLISTNSLREKYVQNKHKGKKTKTIEKWAKICHYG